MALISLTLFQIICAFCIHTFRRDSDNLLTNKRAFVFQNRPITVDLLRARLPLAGNFSKLNRNGKMHLT